MRFGKIRRADRGYCLEARPACLICLPGAVVKYVRYSVPIRPAPNTAPHPNRFKVKINRVGLAKLLVREVIEYRGQMDTVLSRPCVYGVFSAPVGAFMAREQHCVGCLRCTVQHPDIVTVLPNPERLELGDSFIDPDMVETILYEAASGRVPVRGAGYGGTFGGTGWDSMWTDMSEIVRPTRDGIHGREFISTSVQLGWKPLLQELDEHGNLLATPLNRIEIPIPVVFDQLPIDAPPAYVATSTAAEVLGTLAVVPYRQLDIPGLRSASVAPLVKPAEIESLPGDDYRMVELDGWDVSAYSRLEAAYPNAIVVARLGVGSDLSGPLDAGVSTFHLTADYHGQTGSGFVLDAIRATHDELISRGIREQITLIGSGGIAAAEHLPKALIVGLDAVAIETAALIAIQARFYGEVVSPGSAEIDLPQTDPGWAAQRLVNLMGSWRDQLFEILGAMGLREVRRLRGEIGRGMFQADMEREAFAGIEGYE